MNKIVTLGTTQHTPETTKPLSTAITRDAAGAASFSGNRFPPIEAALIEISKNKQLNEAKKVC